MTKSEEIQVLRETIAKLGKDSYCGTWLAEQLPSIEIAIVSDYLPEVYALSIHEARIHCEKLVNEAKEESDKIEARAKADAEKQREAACKFNDMIRADLLRAIESARHQLTRI